MIKIAARQNYKTSRLLRRSRPAMIMPALALPSIAVVSFDYRCTTPIPHVGLSANENARALISMMARSTTHSNQRPDTLMQDRHRQ